jgi:hypothetical protein
MLLKRWTTTSATKDTIRDQVRSLGADGLLVNAATPYRGFEPVGAKREWDASGTPSPKSLGKIRSARVAWAFDKKYTVQRCRKSLQGGDTSANATRLVFWLGQ